VALVPRRTGGQDGLGWWVEQYFQPDVDHRGAPGLSPSWELLLVLTAAGHAHDVAGDVVGPLSRALQAAAARLSESVHLLRLG